jgi:transcription factor CRZ1
MDQQGQGQRGRSPSAGHQQPHIKQSPSPNPYQPNEPSIGLGLAVDPSAQQPFGGAASNDFSAFNSSNSLFNSQQPPQSFAQDPSFDPSQSFSQQFKSETQGDEANLPFGAPAQQPFLSQSFNEGDFSLFPPTTGPGDQFNTPLFDQALDPNDMNNMATPQTHHSPTPPHLLKPDPHQPGSAQHSPAFNQHQFSSSPGSHSRHASLGPEAALLPNQMNEWVTQPQFQGHRRTPSEYSDVSSAAASPNLVSQDTFDPAGQQGHSPMQRASDAGIYDGLNLGNFSISDQHVRRSPSHSPAISPRILPQQLPELNQPPSFGVPPQAGGYAPQGYPEMGSQPFPTLQQQDPNGDMRQMVAPEINIDFAPNSRQNSFEPPKPQMDHESLTPPDRGTGTES